MPPCRHSEVGHGQQTGLFFVVPTERSKPESAMGSVPLQALSECQPGRRPSTSPVCLMSCWQTPGTRVPRSSWQTHLSPSLTPVSLHATSQAGEEKPKGIKAYNLGVLSQRIVGGEKKDLSDFWISTESSDKKKKNCIVTSDSWWCFYLVVHFFQGVKYVKM